MTRLLPASLLVFVCVGFALPDDKPYEPKVAPASKEGQQAIARIRVPDGLTVSLWAAEPLLANPVAFCFDERGRCYVAETFRIHRGVTDNRGHMDWLDDDLASRTVADRVAMYRKHLKDDFRKYEIEHDRVRLIEDTKGAGLADKATVFADGFHSAATGIGAGLLAHKGNVYYTCIPDLWLLRDTRGAGKADVRKALSSGYGVHVSFYGHDSHGLRIGPDGRLYFSIGDRGLNVKTAEGKTIFLPDTGAVLRCELDGSRLEVVATGLRNPQELAFDEYGNLFTGDNNSDSGDLARWVYVVEGGDSGWRIGYQYGSSMGDRGPWNAEKLWHLPHEGQPAYIVPPLAHIADGPSGLTYYPGSGLPDKYRGHFFLCDFRGDPVRSGVWSFALEPEGASFKLVDKHQFTWGVLATDCDFGPDSGFYVSDWVQGWEGTGKGRLYRVTDPQRYQAEQAKEVKKLLAEGFDARPVEELAKLLQHSDMRVRQGAQFALADKGQEVLPRLVNLAKKAEKRMVRLHAIWAAGQILRSTKNADTVKNQRVRSFGEIAQLVNDPDAEVRAQVARMIGDSPFIVSTVLLPSLKDPEPRVRLYAALAIADSGGPPSAAEAKESIQAVLDMLRDNADKDAYLRHAGVMALAQLASPSDLLHIAQQAREDTPAVRMGTLLAMRRQGNRSIARFLSDPEPRLVAEAARAIHDVPIPEAMPELAALSARPGLSEPVLYRALNAHFRLGRANNAAAVGAVAARADLPEKLRVEALKVLADWARPGRRDRVTGLTQDLGTRDTKLAADALRFHLAGIFSGPDKVRQEAARVAAALGVKEVGPTLLALAADTKRAPAVRAEAVGALDALRDDRLAEAVRLALADGDPRLRTAGRRALARLEPAKAVADLRDVLDNGEVIEKQGAFRILSEMQTPAADAVLADWLDRQLANRVPAELQLDVLDAAARRGTDALEKKLAQYDARRPKDDPLAAFRETLRGGDAEYGRRIFFSKTEVACLRCHKVKGEGGEVGPDLSGIGAKQTREYLLESIVEPNRQIAKGFETVLLALKNGQSVSGIIKEENAKEVRLITPEGRFVTVPKDQVEAREFGQSAMPADVMKHLTKSELRDLVEFLAGLK